MAKSRNFSIYLIKEGLSIEEALENNHNLEQIDEGNTNLPEGSRMYIADRAGNPPWWKNYWGIRKELHQVQKGALVFLSVRDRLIALTFGMTHHKLRDNAYEYDFGLRTTLNALDPAKIRSTDILQPENAKRQRIQAPIASSLNFFDIQHDESIIKKLTGAVKMEYSGLFKNATGSSSLRISSKVEPHQIVELCQTLLDIYNSEEYLQSFPDIQNIQPVKDPDKVLHLNECLLEAFLNAPIDLVLAIPEIVDYSEDFKIKYSGTGRSSLEYTDVFISGYRAYLEEQGIDVIEDVLLFKQHYMLVLDENSIELKKYRVYDCFLFDCEMEGQVYHLCEGEWYFIETRFIQKLENSLNPYFIEAPPILHACNSIREDAYNNSVSNANPDVICLDKKSIAPTGQRQVEPCDLISIIANRLHFIHVKISTRSASLSHLFNQGLNSINLLRMEEESRDKLRILINNNPVICNLLDQGALNVTYGLITRKPSDQRSRNLPLFSRISLLRTVNELTRMGIPCSICFIYDNVNRRENEDPYI